MPIAVVRFPDNREESCEFECLPKSGNKVQFEGEDYEVQEASFVLERSQNRHATPGDLKIYPLIVLEEPVELA